jgi:hypothetical protein
MSVSPIVCVIAVATLAIVSSPTYGQGLEGSSNSTVSIEGEESCPTWYLWDSQEQRCICHDIDEVLVCNPATKMVSLVHGHCITYDNESNTTSVAKCAYTFFSRNNATWFTELPSNPNHLNAMCSEWNRDGSLCSQCKEGYGLTITNLYMRCVKCSHSEGVGWLLFFTLQLIPVTVMFAIIIVFRLSIAKPPMNAFVIFSQLSSVILYKNAARFQTPFLSNCASDVFITLRSIYLPILSLWSLSFSHVPKATDFCVAPRLIHQQSHLLSYTSNIYVLLLIAMAYLLIELHARNYRLIVWLWRPFFKCFVRFSRVWNPKLSAIDTFATFLLISYHRFIVLSYFIYAFQRIYRLGKSLDSGIVLSYNPTVSYFSRDHSPYMIVSLFILLTLILPPAIVLAFYQISCCKSCLKCFRLTEWQSLHLFVELFQGCYKDGTGGSHDLRFTASLYLFLRLVLLLTYTLCSYSNFSGCDNITSLILLLSMLLFIAVAQPYRNKIMNRVDIVVLFMLILILALFFVISKSRDTTVNAITLSSVLLLVAIPQVIFYSFLFYKLCIGISKLCCSQNVFNKLRICCFNKPFHYEDELTVSQINSCILLELSEGRFDSSYNEENLSSSVTDYSAATSDLSS